MTGAAGNVITELGRDECLRRLEEGGFGRLAVSGGAGMPIVRPVNYIFDRASGSLLVRTEQGSKLHFLLRRGRAVLEIDEADPSRRTGWSVIASGPVEEVTRPGRVEAVRTRGLVSWAPGARESWVRLRPDTISGRSIEPALR